MVLLAKLRLLTARGLNKGLRYGRPSVQAFPQTRMMSSQAPHINNRPRIVDMKQGDKVSPVFTKGEFERRLSKLRHYMEENNITVSVFTSYHNVLYYSGFLYCAMGRPYGLVVTPTESTLVSAGVDGGQPWRRSYGSDYNVTYTDWQPDNYFHAIKTIIGDVSGNIGLEFDHVPHLNKIAFDAVLPNAKVDISAPAMKMRMVKSEEEISLVKEGNRIAEIGGAAVVEAIQEGVPEYEVVLHSNRTMIREIAKTFPDVELVDTWTWVQSGCNSDGAHNPPTTRKLQKGDIISMNCFPMIAGYYAAMERTLFLESVSDAHLKYWKANVEVHERGLEIVKPGVKCSDIAHQLNEVYQKYDLVKYRPIGYGHSLGSMCHYYGREQGLELRESVDTVLEPNMMVTMEPMILIPEGLPGAGGYREHDILIITEDGADNITKFPYGPEHNIIKNK